MEDNNIDNDHDHDHDHEEQQQAADQRRLYLISLLQRKNTCIKRTGNKIDELVVEFLVKTENDLHEHLCCNKAGDDYQGLDKDRDTEQEVEATIRFFPNVLSRKKKARRWSGGEDQMWVEYGHSMYPIHFLFSLCLPGGRDSRSKYICNLKAVSFVPIVARLAIEFDRRQRGGLLTKGITHNHARRNALRSLMMSSHFINHDNNTEHHRLVDNEFLTVMIRLREMGLLKKKDVCVKGLVARICCEETVFAENRFQFLVEWNPNALTQVGDISGCTPIYYAAMLSTLQGFRMVLEYGIRYFPRKKGISLLFKKSNKPKPNRLNPPYRFNTPFQWACERFGYEQVMQVIHHSAPQLHIFEALLSVAIDEEIHLDCVYFLLRREPDVLVNFMMSSSVGVSCSNDDDDDTNSNENEDEKL